MLTLTEFKRFLAIDPANTSKDELLNECIQSAISEIDSLTNRTLGYSVIEENPDGSGTAFAYLKEFPIVEITKLQFRTSEGYSDIIKEPDSIRDSVLLLSGGQICILKNYVFPPGESNIKAAYTSGYLTADDWAENTKYEQGDIVNYQNVFWRCTM